MKINFLKYRHLFIIFSLLIIVGGITYGLITGYKFDVDFKGGTKIEANINEEFNNDEIQNVVFEITNEKPLIQKVTGGNNAVSITCSPMDEETSDKVVEALKAKYVNMDEPSVRNVQASYGKDLLNSALIAVVVAVALILIYVAIRFKTLGFPAAITAIIALIHDVLFIIAIYGIIKFPINTTFVAVALTIIGYSINDTIIVYDRIRENKKKVTRSKDLLETILERKIENINILNPNLVTDKINNRIQKLDLLINTNNEYINVELNSKFDKLIFTRNLFYIFKLCGSKAEKGKKVYNSNKKIIQINLNFNCHGYKKDELGLYSKQKKLIVTDILTIFNINVDFYVNDYYNNGKKFKSNDELIIMLGLDKEELYKCGMDK